MPTDSTETDGTTPGATEGADQKAASRPDAGVLADLAKERKARQDMERRLAEFEAAKADAERKAAEEAGKHRELYEGLKPKYEEALTKLTAYEQREQARIEAVQQRNAARIAALPDDLRDLVPEGLDPDATTAQIERLEARARKADPGFAKGGAAAGATQSKPSIPEECKAEALRNKRDPEWWFQNVWAPRQKKGART